MLSFPRCHSFCARYAVCAANWPAPDDDALHQKNTKKAEAATRNDKSQKKSQWVRLTQVAGHYVNVNSIWRTTAWDTVDYWESEDGDPGDPPDGAECGSSADASAKSSEVHQNL